MELEKFIEQYKLRNPEPPGDVGRREYEFKLRKFQNFFDDLSKTLREEMTVNQARLLVRAYDNGFAAGGYWESVVFEDLRNPVSH